MNSIDKISICPFDISCSKKIATSTDFLMSLSENRYVLFRALCHVIVTHVRPLHTKKLKYNPLRSFSHVNVVPVEQLDIIFISSLLRINFVDSLRMSPIEQGYYTYVNIRIVFLSFFVLRTATRSTSKVSEFFPSIF